MASQTSVIPPDMRKVYRRLLRWRSAHARRMPIPEALWAAAGGLARQYGINRTAKALHLEYGKLRRRAEVATAAVNKRGARVPAEAVRRAWPGAPPRTGGTAQ